MTKLCSFKVTCQSDSGPVLGRKIGILALFFEIRTSNLFCPSFTSILMDYLIFKSIGPNLVILSHRNLQKSTKMAISQNPMLPKLLNCLHQNPIQSQVFQDIQMRFWILLAILGGIYCPYKILIFCESHKRPKVEFKISDFLPDFVQSSTMKHFAKRVRFICND